MRHSVDLHDGQVDVERGQFFAHDLCLCGTKAFAQLPLEGLQIGDGFVGAPRLRDEGVECGDR
jgi:hypothetical protein